LAIRAVIGQQVSVSAARTHSARIVKAYGSPISDPVGGLTHVFPAAERLADIDPGTFAFPKSRQRCVIELISALATGAVTLSPGCDWEKARHQLLELPGIGPWTTEVIAMRGLGHPDAFPVADGGVRAVAKLMGLPTGLRALGNHSLRWRPWRSYATQHLWASLDHPINHWPPKENT
jgi:AraC family transcriptional regulator, regulatory protein of adaptative response / DNA-3-methyladenine glycosylase II